MDEMFLTNATVYDISNHEVKDKKYLSKILKLPSSHIDTYNKWYMVDGKLYYFKSYSYERKIFNELIGEEFCKMFDISCVHYEFAHNGIEYGIISENYKVPGKEYVDVASLNLPNSNFYEGLKFFSKLSKNPKFLESVKRMIAMDFIRMETDRDSNMSLETTYNDTNLSTINDFERSFINNDSYYNNKYLFLDFEDSRHVEMLMKDEYLLDQFYYALCIKIVNIIEKIMDERDIRIYPGVIRDYTDNMEETKSLIRSKIY